jgi:hypothetical protein
MKAPETFMSVVTCFPTFLFFRNWLVVCALTARDDCYCELLIIVNAGIGLGFTGTGYFYLANNRKLPSRSFAANMKKPPPLHLGNLKSFRPRISLLVNNRVMASVLDPVIRYGQNLNRSRHTRICRQKIPAAPRHHGRTAFSWWFCIFWKWVGPLADRWSAISLCSFKVLCSSMKNWGKNNLFQTPADDRDFDATLQIIAGVTLFIVNYTLDDSDTFILDFSRWAYFFNITEQNIIEGYATPWTIYRKSY